MLRDPVEIMYSLHSQLLFSRMEDIDDFGAALEAEPERRIGRRIPPEAKIVDFLFFRGFSDYEPQVRRYFEVLGRDAVQVILFDEFIPDPAEAYRGTLEFLSVAVGARPPSFAVIIANKERRFELLRALLG